ncbi:MAG: DUF294 nucleotidyltransferase-like domain-containing protein, partial [Pseudomonadota bacterium]
MNEISEVTSFLSTLGGFDALSEAELDRAARATSVAYYRRGKVVMDIGAANDELHVVRQGSVELANQDGDLIARLDDATVFGFPSLMNGAPARNRSTTLEDTLVYHVAGAAFADLRKANDAFDRYFVRLLTDRLLSEPSTGTVKAIRNRRVSDLVSRSPVCIEIGASVRETAAAMVEHRVSAMMVTDGGRMAGILTDRDLRTRVIAAGLDLNTGVAEVMTRDPVAIEPTAHVYDAALAMIERNIHHLPVVDGATVLGMVSRSDFMRIETEHPLYLVSDIKRQPDTESLVAALNRMPALLAGQIHAGVGSEQITKFVTSVTDALTQRLIELATQKLGPAPCDFAWIALGSQARREQSARSDQDNALILADTAVAGDYAYFAELARFVNDGLNDCGYVYCPGEIMACNPAWCMKLSDWRATFRRWITEPAPKALMHANIFFDLRRVAGKSDLVDQLVDTVRELAQSNEIFLAMMAKNAMDFQPPLGFFRQFVLERSGEHK